MKKSKQPRLSFKSFLNPQTYNVAGVTVANGEDNIGIYVPLFARGSTLDLVIIIIVLLLVAGAWCFLGTTFGRHPTVIHLLEQYGRFIVPFVLIA